MRGSATKASTAGPGARVVGGISAEGCTGRPRTSRKKRAALSAVGGLVHVQAVDGLDRAGVRDGACDTYDAPIVAPATIGRSAPQPALASRTKTCRPEAKTR